MSWQVVPPRAIDAALATPTRAMEELFLSPDGQITLSIPQVTSPWRPPMLLSIASSMSDGNTSLRGCSLPVGSSSHKRFRPSSCSFSCGTSSDVCVILEGACAAQ
ncbi:hypothetical protein KP509_31G056700 [Ceratopteris richardii]|uniref:Uncharacterized protein n=1 Tax=Ceratopteris richardii TaxID=49495 RepID=A0A8T2R078_CERRI|nr:hypothetical protein KP509_31G056700 [Ceratopteris richardii]